MTPMLLRELLRTVDRPYIFYEDGMSFVLSPDGMKGTFVKGAKMMPTFDKDCVEGLE